MAALISPSPRVGIFWAVDGAIVSAGCPVDEADIYGDCLTYDGGHAEHWDRWQAAGAAWLAEHALPATILSTEYEAHPRGRVVRAPEGFVIYADPRLQTPGRLALIRNRFRLDPVMTVVRGDDHYRPKAPLG